MLQSVARETNKWAIPHPQLIKINNLLARGAGASQFHYCFIVCVSGKQLVCSQILSVSHHSAIAVRITLHEEYLIHVPNGDPIFTGNIVYISFNTTNIAIFALRRHISNMLSELRDSIGVISFIKIIQLYRKCYFILTTLLTKYCAWVFNPA